MAVDFLFERHYAAYDEKADSARLLPENETDQRVLRIFKDADDLLSSALAERARIHAT